MEKLLVIGAGGLLGGRAFELGKGRFEVFGTYNFHPVKGEKMFQMDVTKRQEVFRIIEKIKPNIIIDTHALHPVDYCETHPEETWNITVNGTKNVAEASKRVGAKYVFFSTDYVFDGKRLSYTEKDKPNPLNYYGKTKWAAEMVLEALGVNHIVARAAVLYGMGGHGKVSFVSWVIEALRKGEKINIVTDQHNNPTFADNLIQIVFKLYEKDSEGLFHITGKECLSRYDFAKHIAKVFGLNSKLIVPITTPDLGQISTRPEKINISTKKVERISGIKTMGIDEGLKTLKMQLEENKSD
ncbi:MAG: NAD(P)-dependent oxidoreductase [Candidatus Aenigmarchaeota archaeon]|nr:NAD(P)-dependent oxidoreductase [Candidatus Aenigmarchaeota archaeon]